MKTTNFTFNRNPIRIGYDKAIEQPSTNTLKNTPALWNASLEDALKYGGELKKAAIGAMNLRFDRKYIVVDTKVHMLMPGMCPVIPNWHSDGVPRGSELRPEAEAKAKPNIFAQETMKDSRFHLLVTGEGCLTEFIQKPVTLEVPQEPSTKLYSMVNQQIREKVLTGELDVFTAQSCTPIEFDWFDIHRGVEATKHEWRFLIRVTETDYMPPQTDLRQVMRTQQQVYVPTNFGW
ncbi:hypothetical protein [Bacillus wiedmannii]|uniref:hypothetical protein n=1 Tax=Bacillus wiedmannii TaxID=1890302 RepID=UPI000BF06617|nr:hypothetical protein [Bacillus wiedmannii]PEJ48417.1 hypothetical protein CN672_13820 [Bacillus wiedmannii]PEM10297.1 hypothetical protein CN610_14010 [Bacillus wiedmannii]PHD09591.1 hypothetical protein COF45_18015 [Bacillus wiedmannii]